MINPRAEVPVGQRLASLALVLAALAALWIAVVAPVREQLVMNAQEIEHKRQQFGQLVARVQSARATGESGATDPVAYVGDFLAGSDAAVIGADLQGKLRSLVLAQQGELTTARALPPRTQDGLELIGLRLQISGDMKSVQAILHAIETQTPLLFIDRLMLRLDDRHGGRNRPVEMLTRMTAEFDVYGARLLDGAPPQASGGMR